MCVCALAVRSGAPPPAAPVEPSKTYAEVLHEEEVTAMIETRVAFFAVQKGGGAEVGGWAWGREKHVPQ